jgi:hypothetical protein
MKRNLLFTISFILLSVISYSQTIEKRVSPFRFAGVHALTTPQGETRGYFTLSAESGSRWEFQIMNTSLETTITTTIEAPRLSTFNTMVSDGDFIIASFVVNAFRTSLTYVVIDNQGNETARLTRENYPLLNQGNQYFPQLSVHPAGGFILVESIGRRPAGYTVEYIDHSLSTIWRREFIPSKGKSVVYGLWPVDEQIIVYEATERNNRTQNTRIHTLNPLTGEHMLTMNLTDAEYTYFPTAINPGANGEIAITGTFFKGDKIKGKSSQGLFFINMDRDGQTLAMELFDWKFLRPLIKTHVYDWFFAVRPEVWIHGLDRNDDGSFTAIAELYRYSGIQRGKSEDRYHRIRLFDFMVFTFDPQGNMVYADAIPRPHMILKLDVDNFDHMASAGPLSRARAMKQYGAFSYRFHRKTENGSYAIAFMSYEAFTHYAYSVKLHDSRAYLQYPLIVSKPRIFSTLQMVDHFSGQYSIGYMINEMNTRKFNESEMHWRGILPAPQGKMLTYEYMPLNGRLTMNLVDAW